MFDFLQDPETVWTIICAGLFVLVVSAAATAWADWQLRKAGRKHDDD